jgi:hypothetical protein
MPLRDSIETTHEQKRLGVTLNRMALKRINICEYYDHNGCV